MEHEGRYLIVIIDNALTPNWFNIPNVLRAPHQVPLRLSTLEFEIGFDVPSHIPDILIDTSKVFVVNAQELSNFDLEENLLGTVFPQSQPSFVDNITLIQDAPWNATTIALFLLESEMTHGYLANELSTVQGNVFSIINWQLEPLTFSASDDSEDDDYGHDDMEPDITYDRSRLGVVHPDRFIPDMAGGCSCSRTKF